MSITLLRAVIIYIFITVSMRIMGKRQVGELNPQELVITILISAVATVPLENNGMPLANSLIPIAIFISFEIINSTLSMKSIKFRSLIKGKPRFIIKDGKILPPFVAISGLGESAAWDLMEGRKGKTFLSIEEVAAACPKVSKTHMQMLKDAGAFGDLPDTSQVSFF